MNLLIDIGNTKTSVYIEKEDKSFLKKNINSKNNLNIIEELKAITKGLHYDYVLISSVVPDVEVLIYGYFKSKKTKIHSLNYNDFSKFISYENYTDDSYHKMGCDRVVADFAAIKRYGNNCVVIDVGTALTIDVIVDKKYTSGYIFPGIDLSKKVLIDGASLLEDFKYGNIKDDNISLDTYTQLNDGIILGTLGAIKVYIQESISHFNDEEFRVVLTGGTMYFLEKHIGIKRITEIIGYDIKVDYDLMSYGLSKAIKEIWE